MDDHTWDQSLPRQFPTVTQKVDTGHGSIYVIVGYEKDKILCIIIQGLKPGGCEVGILESIYRMGNLALLHGATLHEIAEEFRNISCAHAVRVPDPPNEESILVKSVPDGIGLALVRADAQIKEIINESS